jgi:CheY-like chemotaxis protein
MEVLVVAVILVVEDDTFTRDVAEMMISDWDHQTLSASDVPEALALLRSSAHIDALFTDIYLKRRVLGGCELASEAIGLRPNLRVLYTSGNRVTDQIRAQFVSSAHFLSKPYTQQQLHGSVKTMLAA